MSEQEWTKKQGQYLAFIYNYTVIHGEPPGGPDMARFFGVSGPSVSKMLQRLSDKGLVSREPGQARTVHILVPPETLPSLRPPGGELAWAGPSSRLIYQIKVTLRGIEPHIWRRIQVPADVTLARLHDILQVVMDWWDYHLHEFIVGEDHYGVPHPDYPFEMKDESRVRLSQIAEEGSQFVYYYDFGDGWIHDIEVQKVLKPQPGRRYPVCTRGRRAAPPEDVGGVWGYQIYLEAMADPDHPDHEMYLEWRGEFDPEAFYMQAVNAELRKLR